MSSLHLKKIIIASVSLICLIFIPFHGSADEPAGSVKKARVLILHSYHKGLSWTEKIVSGIEKTFAHKNTGDLKIEIDFEYMDTKRFVDESYYKELYDIYKSKSKKIKYDLIISADDNALNFLLKYRNEIYGKIPVVFCGVNFYNKSMLKGREGYTGVVENFDVDSTLTLALKLHPETKEFIFVGDSSTTAMKNRQAVQRAAKKFRKKNIRFKFLNDGDIMRYQRDLQMLSSGSIIIAMLFNRDSDGKFYTYEESFRTYTLNVQIPVYTFWDFYLGQGAVGGMIISGFSQGEAAASRAIDILKGMKITDIPVQQKSPNRYMFDYTQLKKYNISLSDIPANSKIINRPAGFEELYAKYKKVIQAVLAFIGFLMIIIVLLVFNIVKKKRIEKELVLTNSCYDRFVPHEFLDNLERQSIVDVNLGDRVQKEMTVLFSDIRSFTTLSESMTPVENFNFLNSYFKNVSPRIRENRGFIDKYIGDAIMALFPENAEDALSAAIEMQKQIIDYNLIRLRMGREPIAIGCGIHSGELMLGTIGEEKRMQGTVVSEVMDIVDRLEGFTKIFGAKIITTGKVIELLGEKRNKYLYRLLGTFIVIENGDPIKLYEVIDGNSSQIIENKLKTKSMFEKGVKAYFARDINRAYSLFEKVLKVNPEDTAAKRYIIKINALISEGMPEDWNNIESLAV